MHRLISALGILVFLGLAWLMSSHKRRVNPRIIVGGLVLQFVFAAIILQTTYGSDFFDLLDKAFTTFCRASMRVPNSYSVRALQNTSSRSKCCRRSFSFRHSCRSFITTG